MQLHGACKELSLFEEIPFAHGHLPVHVLLCKFAHTYSNCEHSDAGTIQTQTLCMFDCLFHNIASLDIEAIRWLAQDGRVKLSERTRSILLSLVTYALILQSLKDTDEVTLLGASHYQSILDSTHADSALCKHLFSWIHKGCHIPGHRPLITHAIFTKPLKQTHCRVNLD